ncbi:DUF305 domain-containing protein [Rhodococcus chondri]|uniref:DUF305 domain-containing protein n=1 Tax=Rhodococcus chondri TaxID=3065941 RepID=A0ABU7JZ20_9NOCA|nr:hypothetical protein [Rhodococcus sp. CC-R104]MEE2035236.1 DUF305 domain-containing protein [Rhodococcus sp. CC-R104]
MRVQGMLVGKKSLAAGAVTVAAALTLAACGDSGQSWGAAWGQTTMSPGTSMPMTSPNMAMSSPGMGMPGQEMPMQSSAMPGGGMGGMSGMMSAADMGALRSARGVEASRLFLTQMVAAR